jgi:polyvinyl alcohol dehydrogenase (cytochrome)
LRLKWAFGFPDAGSAWAQPTVAGNRLFVGSQNGTVYSLDPKTGCSYWSFTARGGVRTAMTVGVHPMQPTRFLVFFGDTTATAYALDAPSGELVWSRKVEVHPLARVTGAPVLHANRVYVPTSSYEEAQSANDDYECCTFRGSVSALDAASGQVIWKRYVIEQEPVRQPDAKGRIKWGPSGGGIWSSPTIDNSSAGVSWARAMPTAGRPADDRPWLPDLGERAIRWAGSRRQGTRVAGCGPRATNPTASDLGPDYDIGQAPMLASQPGGATSSSAEVRRWRALDPTGRARSWQYRAAGAARWAVWNGARPPTATSRYFPRRTSTSSTTSRRSARSAARNR